MAATGGSRERTGGGRRRERYGACSGERLPEAGEHREVSVNPHAVDATRAERREAEPMLERAELALDGGAAPVEALPLGGTVGDRGQRDRAALAQADDGHHAARLVAPTSPRLSLGEPVEALDL